jgi:hypothetical protein
MWRNLTVKMFKNYVEDIYNYKYIDELGAYRVN